MDEGVATSSASSSSRELQEDPPTIPERSNGVDITDAFDRLDLQCTPKSSRHDITNLQNNPFKEMIKILTCNITQFLKEFNEIGSAVQFFTCVTTDQGFVNRPESW